MNLENERISLTRTFSKFLGLERTFEEDDKNMIDAILARKLLYAEGNLEERVRRFLSGTNICGGAVLSTIMRTKVNDIDIYIEDTSRLRDVKDLLEVLMGPPVMGTDNAITYKRNGTGKTVYCVQLITRFYGHPFTIFETFDFTVTQCAFDISTGGFVFGERFFPDLSARQLIYQGGSSFPICALYRTKKYMRKGFNVSGSTLMHIGLCIVQLEIKTYKQLKEQLHGIDTQFLGPLLDDKDPNADVDVGIFLKEALDKIYGLEDTNED